MAARQLDAKGFDEDCAWKKVAGRIGHLNPKSLNFRTFYKYAVVFLILMMTGIMAWYYMPIEEEKQAFPGMAENILPGSNKAELILSTGEKVTLGKNIVLAQMQQPGALVIVDTVDGQVKYMNNESDSAAVLAYNILKVPKGGEYTLLLSDGSVVWLNSESSLKYPVRFQGKKREVYLEGEAFFKVKSDQTAPFHVYAGKDDIRVLGTSFNVCVYSGEPFWHTTLVEGKVAVSHNGKELYLNPSEQYQLNIATQEVEVKQVETALYTSWINGKMYFKGLRLEDIARQLERWYNFQIFYENEEVKDLKFRGVINKYAAFDVVLKILEQTTNVCFDIKGNTVIAKKNYKTK